MASKKRTTPRTSISTPQGETRKTQSIADSATQIDTFVTNFLIVAEQLKITSKPLKDFELTPDQVEVLLLVPSIKKAVKNKLAKEPASFTAAEVAGLATAVADELPAADSKRQVALLQVARHLMDRLHGRINGEPNLVETKTGIPQADLQPLDRDSLLKLIIAKIPFPLREEECADGSLVFVGGDPGEVVVRVARSRITVSVFGIVWEGSQTPVVCPQPLMSLHWRRLPGARLTTILHEMIEAARQLRRASYCKCARCGEIKPPEWMHGTGACQSCAQHEP